METFEIALPKNLETLSLPDPTMVNYWRMAENRIFYIDFEIDETILETQRSIININIQDSGKKVEERIPIIIMIDSPGGMLSETMSLCSTIIMSKTPVITVNVAEAYSGAALLLLSGHKRYCFPYSKTMLHSGSGATMGTFEQTEAAQKMYKKQVDEMAKYILERSNIDQKTFNKNKSKDWYLDAEESVKYGIVDDILTDFDEIFNDRKFSF